MVLVWYYSSNNALCFLLIFSNISYSIESSTCKFELNNFEKYRVNLLDCIKENGETPPKDLLVNLSEKSITEWNQMSSEEE